MVSRSRGHIVVCITCTGPLYAAQLLDENMPPSSHEKKASEMGTAEEDARVRLRNASRPS